MQVTNRRLKSTRYKKHKRKIHQRFRNNIFEREIKKIFLVHNTFKKMKTFLCKIHYV